MVEVTDWGDDRRTWTRRDDCIPVSVGEVDARQYGERTLAIEISDHRTHELVWAGSMAKEPGTKITPEKLQETINAILAKLPPAPTRKP